MSKTVIRITPVGGFDIPGLENWFAVMAGKGLRFSMTTGPLTIFEKTAQQTVQIHLEPIRGAVNDDPELNALYEDAGWHYWGIFRGSFYVFASDDLTAQAHTDSETQDYALKRFFKEKVIGGVLLAFGNVLCSAFIKTAPHGKLIGHGSDIIPLRPFPTDLCSRSY